MLQQVDLMNVSTTFVIIKTEIKHIRPSSRMIKLYALLYASSPDLFKYVKLYSR